jgi:hypothetical protein
MIFFIVEIRLFSEHLTSDRHSNLECKFCQKTFADSKHLKEHMKRIHLVNMINLSGMISENISIDCEVFLSNNFHLNLKIKLLAFFSNAECKTLI